MSKYDDLVTKLKEIFQIDRPELDFGVYRILNARVGEINDYLENRLKAKVSESLAASGANNKGSLYKELQEKEAQYHADGIDPESVPKIREMRQKLAEYSAGNSEHENAVFTHLLTFFSRYYDKGDFISQRRYKGDIYAIPYAGEEVVLHWANKDQYYTKSGENFFNYAFKLDDGRSVRFRLVTADTAKDNRKDNDKERRFVLIEPQTRILTDDDGDEVEEALLPVAEENGELVLRFEYKVMPKGSKQDDLVSKAVKTILDDPIIKARWLDLANREPTEKNPQRTLLEKCLTNYTAKNTADYFIHKDLGGFLRRELDFYIKNEVMNLDDVQNAEKFANIEKNLRLIQTLRAIALDLITFLAQLEDFQKKLWLKKKFVVATHYCFTLDRIIGNAPQLLDTIAANPRQWEQWDKLGMLGGKTDLLNLAEAGSVDYLKEHPYLMLDTSLFDASFKQVLLATVDNLDENIDGLLLHSDNFQALSFIDQRYTGKVDCIYIDPPYNTNATPILYKNEFKSSSWMSFLENRLSASLVFLKKDSGYISVAIDDNEISNLSSLIKVEYPQFDLHKAIVNHYPGSGTGRSNVSRTHEYALFMVQEDLDILRGDTTEGGVRERGFCRSGQGENNFRSGRPNSFYAVLVDAEKKEIKGIEPPPSLDIDYPKCLTDDGLMRIYPIGQDGSERCWTLSYETAKKHIDNNTGILFCSNNLIIKRKYFDEESRGLLPSVWVDKKFSAVTNGTNLLTDIFGEGGVFSYPKSLYTVLTAIEAGTHQKDDAFFLDYFAGSGTTAHAVIALNRQDGGSRKYALVEQGEYFETVTKPRIQKVVYSADWKDGKATAPETGTSHAFKILKLESYEDTLNNLELHRTEAQQSLLDMLPESAQEDYLLRYLLDIESRGSLLSVQHFERPFDCKLKVTVDSAGAYEERSIDLVETFNYLIGLRVKHIDMQLDKGFLLVIGWLPSGEKTLVLWRNVDQVDYDALNRLCDRLAINPADSEFEVVYINGDHNIPAVFTSLETDGGITKTLKIRQIEPEFLSHMFTGDGQ
jgi:adenine-specific DNA-methyltransferase